MPSLCVEIPHGFQFIVRVACWAFSPFYLVGFWVLFWVFLFVWWVLFLAFFLAYNEEGGAGGRRAGKDCNFIFCE